MFEGILQAFTIPEVRKRILFTLGAFAIFRLGAWIPVPGVDPEQVRSFFQNALGGGILGFLNLFTGQAFENFSLFALGVIPYINASIIMSLLQSVIPYFKELQKQGEEGRKIIQRYVRYGTVGLALLQALGISFVISNQGLLMSGVSPVLFYFTSVVTLTASTIFLMWLGERITENGIGRGVSMIIMAGIIAGYPGFLNQTIVSLSPGGGTHPIWAIALIAMFVIVVAGVVLIQLGARRIDIQYAKRMVRGRVYGGQNTYIPFGVNQGGVIPIIFAAAILTLPQTLVTLPAISNLVAGGPDWLQALSADLQRGGWIYLAMYGLMIIFFTYFYSSIVFNPQDLADNLRRWGGFIPGIRPGKSTSDYVERIQTRLLTIGALFLASIALLPYIVTNASGLSAFFALGGTSILIVVGVGVDTVKQIEAHMVERHYESLIRKGAVLGRKI
ncbi:MAG: preprotein translocase subunit SecY [Candidatus Fraserbacteria bacterium RBG_16_55_9]|uniref:Protein translocase subunit SecY n=1 Tax=Fraserbacteria sp. (strain RBG_16_55_9) TaxID=1817864 RepID=A0A1F5UPH5_FRAXR|nr:MAG: preprotein translocase subunit SecY [Candidatus Fraserbacteria bacterium RBG_16_55_9]